MQWLISLGLLSAVLGWLLTVLHRLEHLHGELSQSWSDWVRRTRRRNAALRNFMQALRQALPEGVPAGRELEQLADASDRRLEGSGDDAQGLELRQSERQLEQTLNDTINAFRNNPQLSARDELVEHCAELCLAMSGQARCTRSYNACAAAYNDALLTPSARLAAPLLGYRAVQLI